MQHLRPRSPLHATFDEIEMEDTIDEGSGKPKCTFPNYYEVA